MKTVFFGPFVGEFGWEMLYWHAWVNKVSNGKFKNYKKIVASFSGRESFYPNADEYWAHPEEFNNYFKSSNGYITDFWMNGFPRGNESIQKNLLGILKYESWKYFESSKNQVDVKLKAEELLNLYKKKLPDDAEYFIPFSRNSFDGKDFGIFGDQNPKSDISIRQIPIPFKDQLFSILEPPKKTFLVLKDYIDLESPLIAIYPRNRINRRPDKNWNKINYIELINNFKKEYSDHQIGIFGSPGEAFFDDKCPEGCIDLINIPNNQRMNIQVAALKQAKLAIGSLSGAMVVARSCNVPVLTWGLSRDSRRFHDENQLDIETIFHPIQNPTSEEIFKLSSAIINKEIDYKVSYKDWCSLSFLKNRNGNKMLFRYKLKDFFEKIGYASNRIFN